MFNIRTSKIQVKRPSPFPDEGTRSQERGLLSAQGHIGHVCGWAETRGTKSVEPSSVLSATMMKKKKKKLGSVGRKGDIRPDLDSQLRLSRGSDFPGAGPPAVRNTCEY